MSRPEQIKIVVITSAEDLEEDFNTQQPLQVVFNRAMALVGGQEQSNQFTLEFDNQTLEDLHAKLGDLAERYGWGDSVELELVPRPEVI